jgi:deoxyhypusine synthase
MVCVCLVYLCTFFLSITVLRYDFNQGVNYEEIMKSYLHMGFQGSNLGASIEEIKRMVCF